MKLDEGRYINLNARWENSFLLIMVENSFNGQINKSGSRILSSKETGGLGFLSIRRLLTVDGDDFDTHYTDSTFAAMVKLKDRTAGNL